MAESTTVELEHRTVQAGGAVFHVVEAGPRDADPIVLLHGFPETWRAWDAVYPALARHHRVLMPDLKGFGGSQASPPWDPFSMARELALLVEALGAQGCTLVGHDWGGVLAWQMAIDYPHLFRRLCIVNAPYHRWDPLAGWYIFLLNLPLLPEALLKVAGPQLVRSTLRSYAERPIGEEQVEAYARQFENAQAREAALGYYRGLLRNAGRLQQARKAKVTLPTLLLWGRHDKALPEKLVQGHERRVPDLRVELIECGHFVPEERPDVVVDRLERFIAGTPGARPAAPPPA